METRIQSYNSVVLVNLDRQLREHSDAWDEADLSALSSIGSVARKSDCLIGCYRRFVEQLSNGKPRGLQGNRIANASRTRGRDFLVGRFSHCDRRAEQSAVAAARIDSLVERLRRSGYRCVSVPGYDPDDVIATLATVYKEFCSQVRIVSDNERLEPLQGGAVWIELADPMTFLDRGRMRWWRDCEPSQIADWSVLDRALRTIIRDRSERGLEVRRILARYQSVEGLFAQMKKGPTQAAEFFAHRMEVLAHLRDTSANIQRDRRAWDLDTNVPLDAIELLQKPAPGVVHPIEQALLGGESWKRPELLKNYEQESVQSHSMLESRATQRERAGGGRDAQLEVARIDGRPAVLVDCGNMTGQGDLFPRGVIRFFSSVEARDVHLEQLWRRGEAY